ncbi:MAG TPA: carboxypeptidase-like regulatory domain-containing protein, partial [Bacteroidales bacterium]
MLLAVKENLPEHEMIIRKVLMVVCMLVGLVVVCNVEAQDKTSSDPQVTVDVKDMPFRSFLTVIEQQIPYKFAYSTDLIEKQKNITVSVQNKSIDDLLRQVLKGTNIAYSIIDNQIVLNELSPPSQITISGYVKDSISGETLPGAIIYLPQKKTGTYTNNYGFYSITQNQTDSLDVLISYVGFNRINRTIRAQHNASVNFYLSDSKTELNTVIVTKDQPDDNVKKHASGKTDISMEMVKTVPSVNGNGDIMNTIQMLPGVMAGLDGRPGYFIRGGNTDQNLVQLDEATLYNPNHLLGLVGIFNSSAIKSAYLLKAGFPASFGDHLSSVLDVTMKDGSDQQLGGDVQAGTIAG